jgi:hypothetical protein
VDDDDPDADDDRDDNEGRVEKYVGVKVKASLEFYPDFTLVWVVISPFLKLL